MADDIPTNIGAPASRALAAAGYTSLDHMASVSARELLQLHGVGPKAIRILSAALEARGQTFRPA